MKLFVAFGYNDRDRWIEDLVVPLVHACGFDPVTGKAPYGQPLDDVLRQRIRTCDGVIGFLTQRSGPASAGAGNETHRWVIEELAYARAGGKFHVEFRESGVSAQPGGGGAYVHIPFDSKERDKVMLAVAQALGDLRNSHNLLQLLPDTLIREIGPLLKKDPTQVNIECRFLSNTHHESDWVRITPIAQLGSIMARVSNVPPDASHLKVRVSANGNRYESDYQSRNCVAVNLD